MRKDVNGLVMIAASLLVIASVIALVAQRELTLREEQTRAQGVGLANSLSRVPLDRLVPAAGEIGPLVLLRSTQTNSLFAYAAVVGRNGETLSQIAVPGVEPPQEEFALPPPTWSEERRVRVGAARTAILEFTAPIVEAGELAAQVRIGFFEPGYAIVLEAASFHATVAFLVFLLTPMALLWLKKEMRPLTQVAAELESASSGNSGDFVAPGPAWESTEELVHRLRTISERVHGQTESMERERMALLASTKVLTFQKHRVETVFECYPDAILALDETGKLTVANLRAETVLRRSREELIGSPPAAWSPAPEVTALIGRYARSSNRLMRAESVEFSSDALGDRRFVASVHPIPSGNGAVVAIRDISLEFIARKNQAEFLAHMAHELKAPLNVMGMYSESLFESAGDDASRVEACNVIRDEIERLNGLINNIFSIGRIETGNVALDRQRIRTKEFLADAFASVSRGGSALNLEFEEKLPDNMNPVFADKQLLSVALKNLLTNAIKYNREGGKVVLSAEETDEGLAICVADTGHGIPEPDLERVFDKFYRSEDQAVRKVAGHGLGLALVKEIITLHGGEIRVASELGEGSRFTFFFNRNCAIFREGS